MDINWEELLMSREQAVNELIVKFNGIVKEYKKLQLPCPIESVEGRVKQIGSILEKANRKNILYDELEERMEDIAGIRIICRFVEDIDKVVTIIREREGHDLCVLEERDYVTNTKPSGYRSYHIHISYPVFTAFGRRVVKVEIQIRTMAMNFWAAIEHSLKYKYKGNMPEILQKRLRKSAEAAFQLDKEMGKISGEILEGQRIISEKNGLADQIINNIQDLNNHEEQEKVNELNDQFYEIYKEGNLDKLGEFNEKLTVMAKLYNVGYL